MIFKASLALLALASLVIKRRFETPRRPWYYSIQMSRIIIIQDYLDVRYIKTDVRFGCYSSNECCLGS